MIKEATAALINGKDLTYEQANAVINEIMNGETSQVQTAAFLTALSTKGETIEEITACAAAMRSHALPVQYDGDLLEIVGTGGDGAGSFNISTTSSIVIAAGGVPVAKHGNRSISSKSGAGDVLEQLGVNIMMEPEKVEACVDDVGIGFMFAQTFNKSMRFVGQARSEMGVRTVFNILGPLANPSGAKGVVVGVYDPALTETIANVMGQLGVKRALVVSGRDHMDEITLSTKTVVSELKDGVVKTYEIAPEDFGFKIVDLAELQGGTAAENAEITRAILSGKEQGAKREIVLLNAGAALYIGGKADSIADGIILAKEAIDSGKAAEVLGNLVNYTK